MKLFDSVIFCRRNQILSPSNKISMLIFHESIEMSTRHSFFIPVVWTYWRVDVGGYNMLKVSTPTRSLPLAKTPKTCGTVLNLVKSPFSHLAGQSGLCGQALDTVLSGSGHFEKVRNGKNQIRDLKAFLPHVSKVHRHPHSHPHPHPHPPNWKWMEPDHVISDLDIIAFFG